MRRTGVRDFLRVVPGAKEKIVSGGLDLDPDAILANVANA